MLNITQEINFDNSIIRKEIHSHHSYSTLSYSLSDEIKICVRQPEICTLPSESYIYIEGVLTKADGSATSIQIINNGFSFLFEEARLEVGGVIIDRNRNCGITSTMKAYCSLNPQSLRNLNHAGWYNDENDTLHVINETTGQFSGVIPLKMLLGFAEDYKKVLVQTPQELILTRSKSDINALISTRADDVRYKLTLNRVSWHMPYINLSDTEKIRLYKVIRNEHDIPIVFRTWELYEYPTLPKASSHSWAVKTASSISKPRFIIVGLQTNKKDNLDQNMSHFDACDIRSVRAWLNSEVYPYEITNVQFSKNNHVIFYEQYLRFRKSYYDEYDGSMLTFKQFSTLAPLFVIDCSKQNDSIKSGTVDVRIEIQSIKDFPDRTTLYALVLSERIIENNPAKSIVKVIQ